MVIRQELEFLALQEERKEGYSRVATPHIAKEALYYRSRHLPYYNEGMYAPLDIDGENYYLRPMNCPHHHLIYGATRHSYRELPIRIAEYGQDYRYEASGGLSGLMRVRGFCMNDAHIYCRYDQAKDEFIRVLHLHARYYELMGIKEYYMRLSLPDMNKLDKYVDEPDKWVAALDIIKQAMDESGYQIHRRQGRSRVLRPQDRLHDPLGHRHRIHDLDQPARLPRHPDLRPEIYRRGRRGASGLCHPSRAARHA